MRGRRDHSPRLGPREPVQAVDRRTDRPRCRRQDEPPAHAEGTDPARPVAQLPVGGAVTEVCRRGTLAAADSGRFRPAATPRDKPLREPVINSGSMRLPATTPAAVQRYSADQAIGDPSSHPISHPQCPLWTAIPQHVGDRLRPDAGARATTEDRAGTQLWDPNHFPRGRRQCLVPSCRVRLWVATTSMNE